MLGWLYRILIGSFKSCDHNWEVYKEHPMIRHRDDDGGRYGTHYIQKCTNCGKLHNFIATNKG